MKKRTVLLLTIGILIFGNVLSQNPFKSLGIPDEDVKVLTLSKGKYQEFHEDNLFERVGSAVINMSTGKIAYFINRDTLLTQTMLEPDISSRFVSIDPLASEYPEWTPYGYCLSNPIKYIDPDGRKVVIANNTSQALTNLAMIAATSRGRNHLNQLISSRQTYTMQSTFWSSSSAYDGNGEIGRSRTAYYVGSAWRSSVGGGAISSLYAMGHEINHAYDHDLTGRAGEGERKSRERSSVNFTNYLRSAHGDGDGMRTSYSGLGLNFSGNESVYNNQNEKVSDFTQTLDVSFGGNTVMGFSYNTSVNGEEAKTSYSISLKTESGQYAYRVFDNQKEYNAAVGRIQNLKNKEDEKK